MTDFEYLQDKIILVYADGIAINKSTVSFQDGSRLAP